MTNDSLVAIYHFNIDISKTEQREARLLNHGVAYQWKVVIK